MGIRLPFPSSARASSSRTQAGDQPISLSHQGGCQGSLVASLATRSNSTVTTATTPTSAAENGRPMLKKGMGLIPSSARSTPASNGARQGEGELLLSSRRRASNDARSSRRQSLEYRNKHFRMKLGLSRLYELQPDPYDCSQRQYLRVCIFRDVKNAVELRRLLRRGDIDAAMIRPELVAEPFVLLAAANRAIHQAAHNRMYTRSLSAELIYSLSPTRNISESLNVFGIAESSRDLIVAIFGDANGKRMKEVAKRIEGKAAPLEALRELRNMTLVKRVYRVGEPELNAGDISDAIVERILAKDIG